MPRWQHVVVVIEENHSYAGVLGGDSAPYLRSLAAAGASFTESFAVTHPSQPNYLALFSGATQQLTDDSCPHSFGGENLGHQVLAAGYSFVGYSEGLPATGSRVCTSGNYARKHAPWVDFTDLPHSVDQPFSAFPTDFTRLPSVSFVIPDLQHDMHDGTVTQADTWLRAHLGSYARWAPRHHSLLIVTWDEDDDTARNQIPTVAAGAGVRVGPDAQHITQYSLLRTLEESFGLRPIGAAAHAPGITALGG